MSEFIEYSLFEYLVNIEVVERLFNEYNGFWKSLEHETKHNDILIELHRANNIAFLHIILPEIGLNEYQIKIGLCKVNCFNILKSKVVNWSTANIIDEVNELVVFVDTYYLSHATFINSPVHNNWLNIVSFTKNLLLKESRNNKIDYLLNTI